MSATSLPNPANRTGTGWHHVDAGDTERGAAASSRDIRLTKRMLLLEHFQAVGEHGSTDPESQEATGMSLPGDAGARRHELVALGHRIEDSGKRRLSPRGKPCIVWVLR